MAVPRLLRNLHKNLHRLASFVLCLQGAHRTRSATAAVLAETYRSHLQRRIAVPTDEVERILAYLSDRGLSDRYLPRRLSGSGSLAERVARGEPVVELQDWFLSDPNMPSSTGREREQSLAKTVSACAELAFLDARTLTVSTYGQLLIALGEEAGFQAAVEEQTLNPFLPSPVYTPAAYLQVLRYDSVLQHAVCEAMRPRLVSFRDHIVPQAEEILQRATAAVPTTVANRDLTSWLRKQVKNAHRLSRTLIEGSKKGANVARPTLFRPLEDVFLPRLEFLVDYGVLRKLDPGRYVYETTEIFDGYKDLLRADAVETAYFAFVAKSCGSGDVKIESPNEILEHLRPSFERLRGLTGYAPIVEATVYANLRPTNKLPRQFAELRDTHEALRALASRRNPPVRVIADRFRRPRDFSIVD